MGDMADYMIDSMFESIHHDWGPDPEDFVPSQKQCKHCKTDGLHWQKTKNGKWWLYDKDNNPHTCKETK